MVKNSQILQNKYNFMNFQNFCWISNIVRCCQSSKSEERNTLWNQKKKTKPLFPPTFVKYFTTPLIQRQEILGWFMFQVKLLQCISEQQGSRASSKILGPPFCYTSGGEKLQSTTQIFYAFIIGFGLVEIKIYTLMALDAI